MWELLSPKFIFFGYRHRTNWTLFAGMALSHSVYLRNPVAIAEALQNRSWDTAESLPVSSRTTYEGANLKRSFFGNGDQKFASSQVVSEPEMRQPRRGKQRRHAFEVNSTMMQAVPLPMKSVEGKNM